MTKDEFFALDYKTKEAVLEEALALYTLIDENPISYEEMKVFAEWRFPKWGEELKEFLYGIYSETGEDSESIDLVVASDKVLDFVRFWNRAIHYRNLTK